MVRNFPQVERLRHAAHPGVLARTGCGRPLRDKPARSATMGRPKLQQHRAPRHHQHRPGPKTRVPTPLPPGPRETRIMAAKVNRRMSACRGRRCPRPPAPSAQARPRRCPSAANLDGRSAGAGATSVKASRFSVTTNGVGPWATVRRPVTGYQQQPPWQSARPARPSRTQSVKQHFPASRAGPRYFPGGGNRGRARPAVAPPGRPDPASTARGPGPQQRHPPRTILADPATG